MNYAVIKKNDIANGKGVRISLFVSGCRHRCKNCFNSEAWDFSYGSEYNASVTEEILSLCKPAYVAGLSILGGEPFEPENREELINLCEKFKAEFPEKNIWCYTGFLYEDIVNGRLKDPESAKKLLALSDVLVDGRFDESLKDLSLLFRGSSNQRIIDVKKSAECGKAVPPDGKWERKTGSRDINDAV